MNKQCSIQSTLAQGVCHCKWLSMLGQSVDKNNSQFEMVDKELVLVILKDATDFLTVYFVSPINSNLYL